MGKSGAMFVRGGYEAVCPALPVKAHSTVGAGERDGGGAGVCMGSEAGRRGNRQTVYGGIGRSSDTIGTKPPAKELVEELKMQVKIESAG